MSAVFVWLGSSLAQAHAAFWLDAGRTWARPCPHLVPTRDGLWRDNVRTQSRLGADCGSNVSLL